jgi:ring-1,2-phenylacetyl-CoA epoxidase subunit PaaC
MLKLGDGTEESHRRVQRALDELWRFTPELFAADEVDRAMLEAGIGPDLAALHGTWDGLVRDVVARATLTLPDGTPRRPGMRGGRSGVHTEALGHMLAEMQIVARSHPGATW